MIVYPAIDIRAGRCVRLVEGDFARETTFDADPVDAARRWTEAGAGWLHVVDLDGAVAGQPVNGEAVRRIAASVSIPVQLGGGLRSLDHIGSVFALGISRVVLGTAAVHDRRLVEAAVARWPGQIAVGLDARDGKLATGGWLEQTDREANSAAMELRAAGVEHLIYTDIHRDGTLQGPNVDALRDLTATVDGGVIASGGIGSLADIEAVRETGVDGVIVGRALYDQRLNLREALHAAKGGVHV